MFNWKKSLSAIMTGLIIGVAGNVNVVDAANIKDHPRVSVMQFGNKAITSRGLRGTDFASASEYAIYQLSACDWFDLIDYEQLSNIAQMHSINMSGLVDPATVAQLGKISGAQFLVVGNVTGLTTKENKAFLQAGAAKGGNAQHVVTANVSLRIVDIETGRIVVSGLGNGSSTSTYTELSFKKIRTIENLRGKTVTNTNLNNVVNEMTARNTSSAGSTKDIDNRNVNSNSNSNYTRSDNDRVTDFNINTNDRSSSFNKQGQTNSGNTYKDDAQQVGALKGNYNNTGSSNTNLSNDREINDNSNRVVTGNATHTEDYKQNLQADGSQSTHGNTDTDITGKASGEYFGGEQSLTTSGGPAEGQGQGSLAHGDLSKMTVYNSEAQYGFKGVEIEQNSDYEQKVRQKNNSDTNWQGKMDASQTGSSTDNFDITDDYERTATDKTTLSGSTSDNRNINLDASYEARQLKNGQSGSYSNYQDTGDAFNNNRTTNSRDYNASSGTDIKSNNNQGYTNNGNASHSYNNQLNDVLINQANNSVKGQTENKYYTYDKEETDYKIVIGTVEVSDVQVRNAISKAVRDAIYGKMGIMTTLNNGKPMKIKTGF